WPSFGSRIRIRRVPRVSIGSPAGTGPGDLRSDGIPVAGPGHVAAEDHTIFPPPERPAAAGPPQVSRSFKETAGFHNQGSNARPGSSLERAGAAVVSAGRRW